MYIAYHEYFILMLHIVHGDHQRCKAVRYTVKQNRLIVRLWLLGMKRYDNNTTRQLNLFFSLSL